MVGGIIVVALARAGAEFTRPRSVAQEKSSSTAKRKRKRNQGDRCRRERVMREMESMGDCNATRKVKPDEWNWGIMSENKSC